MDDPGPLIDAGTALTLLTAAVWRRGRDHVYQPVWVDSARYLTCRYARDGRPDCIVGEVLASALVPIEVLAGFGDDGIRELWLAGRLPLTLTFGALVVLHRAQVSQDRGLAWGEVLDHAFAAARSVLDLVPNRLFPGEAGSVGRSCRGAHSSSVHAYLTSLGCSEA